MARYVSNTKRRIYRGITKFFAILTIIASLLMPVILILDITSAFPIMTGVNRIYTIKFYIPDENEDSDEEQKWILYYSIQTPRSMTIDYSGLTEPIKNGSIYKTYRFGGWDLNDDGYEDFMPIKSNANWYAKAVFYEVRGL